VLRLAALQNERLQRSGQISIPLVSQIASARQYRYIKGTSQEGNLMKLASTIARYLLALVFIVFGLNGFLHFIPQPPPTSEMAAQFFTVMFASHYLAFVFGLQLIAGVLFLFRRTAPLALTIAGPLIVNILLFHALMDPGGIVPGLVVTVLWLVVYWQFRAAFYGIFFTEAKTDRSR
jgi:putative oxidoreductase